jgi:hypothetical protein
MTRKKVKEGRLHAMEHKPEPSVKTSRLNMYIFSKPNRLPSHPVAGMVTAADSIEAVMIHVTVFTSVRMEVMIRGKATLTVETSMMAMKVPAMTIPRMTHL